MEDKKAIEKEINEEYWLQKLSGINPAVSLPLISLEKEFTEKGRRELEIEITENTFNALKAMCNSSDVGLLVLVLSALNVLLYKYSGREDIVIAIPPLAKCDAGILYLRNRISADLTFKEAVKAIKESILSDLDHQDYEGISLCRLPEEKAGEIHFTDIAFCYKNIQTKIEQEDKFDIYIELIETSNTARLRFQYNAERYTQEIISFFANNLIYILGNFQQALNRKISELDYISPDEKYKLLKQFNTTEKAYPREVTLWELFEEQASKTPDKTALSHRGQSISYKELNSRANRLGRYLRKKGIGPNKVVALIDENSIDMIAGLLAILKAGGVYLPISENFPEDRAAFMLEDSDASVVLGRRDILDRFDKAIGSRAAISFDDCEITEQSSENLDKNTAPSDLVYIMYTSGSTGKPKGVMIQHYSITNQMYNLIKKYSFDGSLSHILMAPITFDPSIQQIFLPIITGGTLHIISEKLKLDMKELMDYIRHNAINILNTVPSLMSLLLSFAEHEEPLSFQYIILAGEVFHKSLYTRLRQSFDINKLINIYGPTEASINSTLYECGDREKYAVIPIGKPLPNYKTYILDKALKPVAVGVLGELCISGDGVAKGYCNNPDRSKTCFPEDPFNEGSRLYRTGDMARWLPDGNIEFVGRDDNVIKIGGKRIDLGEIESALSQNELIEKAVVLTKENARGNKQLWAYIISSEELHAEELRAYLGAKLPQHMIPAFFVKVDHIPLTVNHKIDVNKLLENNNFIRSKNNYGIPKTETEKKLHSIWANILGTEQIGLEDNFFGIGGNSLNAIELSTSINKEFDTSVSLRDIFEMPTIGELAVLIESNAAAGQEKIPAAPAQELYELSPNQERMWILHNLLGSMNMYGGCIISGILGISKLQAALDILIDRHEGLRTTFTNRDGQVKQKINTQMALKLDYRDFRGMENAEKCAQKELREIYNEPFELEKGPLARAVLIQTGDAGYILMLVLHHIISDGTSLKILSKELFSLYAAISSGKESKLPELKIQYKDYAEWLNKKLAKEAIGEYEKYWLDKFKGKVPALELPTDFRRPPLKKNTGRDLVFSIPQDIAEKLDALCQTSNSTLFMILLSAVYVLMSFYTGQEDIVIGTIAAGRQYKELENVIGYFINTLALRTSLDPGESFAELLRKVRMTSLEAFEYQLYPFDSLAEKLELERDLSRNMLYDVAVNVSNINYDEAFLKYDDFSLRYFKLEDIAETINSDLQFDFKKTEKGIEGCIAYDIELFEENRIRLMSLRYTRLLEAIVKNFDARVSELISELRAYNSQNSTANKKISIDFEL